MANKVLIGGTGRSPFGKLPRRTALDLEVEAAIQAMHDAGIKHTQIDGLLVDPGPAQGVVDGVTPHYLALGELLGLNPDYTGAELLGGAGSIAIIQRAVQAIEAGLCSVCLCVYGDTPHASADSFEYGRGDNAAFGLFGAVGVHAMAARRHMHLWGTNESQLAEVAIAARGHAAKNRNAQLQDALTIDEYYNTPYVVEPLRKPDCCLVSDGAAAVIVISGEYIYDLPRPPVAVVGYGQSHSFGTWSSPDHFDSLPAARSGARTLDKAGLTTNDIDVVQFYDCFTIVVLMQLEAYGFCPQGESGPFVQDGHIGPEGDLPVNTGGGLLAEAYGGGMLHVIEAVQQLRGEAGERQISNAETALVSGLGLAMNAHTTLILGNGNH